MSQVKLRKKPIFQIFHNLKNNRIMLFCNLFMERPSYGSSQRVCYVRRGSTRHLVWNIWTRPRAVFDA